MTFGYCKMNGILTPQKQTDCKTKNRKITAMIDGTLPYVDANLISFICIPMPLKVLII